MKKKILTLLLAFALSVGLAVPAAASAQFSDVPGTYWAYNEVIEAVNKGITNGYSDGTFKPGNSVTNAHFAAFLARAFYSDEYNDKNADPWYKPYTDTLVNHDILKGTTVGSDLNGNINKAINRYDMARMMYNVLVDQGATLPTSSELKTAQNAIGDWLAIPANYKNAVAACYAMGVLNGQNDGTFGGNNLMNWAQGCVVVYRLTEKIETGSTGVETPTKPSETETPTEPAETGTLTNGKPITEENVIALLKEMEQKYPNGTSSGSNDYYTSIYFGTGRECAGFAFKLSDAVFGNVGNQPHIQTDHTKIRPGDIIEIMKDGKDDHWTTALTAIDSEGYIQSTVDGNQNGVVAWNYNCWKSRTNGYNQGFEWVVYTRYPD